MCILFFYVVKAKHHNQILRKKYIKFIIAANRDEFYFRPSKPAQFWERADANILAGQDKESKGTWLGINRRTGRLAAITNIMGGTLNDPKNPKISRGALIKDYLSSSSALDGPRYCMKLFKDSTISERFNKFNLLTVDFDFSSSHVKNKTMPVLKHGETNSTGDDVTKTGSFPSVTYFSNANTTNALPISLNSKLETDQTHQYFGGISNSIWENPFQKVVNGCQEFENIVTTHNTSNAGVENVHTFRNNLFHFLRSRKAHFPDEQIERHANALNKPLTRYLSSIFVSIPLVQYGTRTHSIIFVDSENQVNFHEWTLTEPINTAAKHSTWMESNFRFQLFLS